MKYVLWVVAAIIGFILVALVGLSVLSRFNGTYGLEGNRLKPCESSLNCVNSEHLHSPAYVEPIHVKSVDDEKIIKKVQQIIQQMGGEVTTVDKQYLHATFTSKLLRFIDDFEVRLDTKQQLLQLRSSSRVGKKDLGVNKSRVDAFKALFVVDNS